MCTVSMIGDFYNDKWKQYPWYPQPPQPAVQIVDLSFITRDEFEALKKEVQDLKALLARAKEYDARTGQPDCEIEGKITLLRAVAKAVGVDLDSVLKPPEPAVKSGK